MGQEKQSKDWHQPLRLEIALQTMLKALPHLEDAVIRKMKMVDAWGPILVRHGMRDAATKLTAALKERRTTAARQSADPTLTTLPRDPIHLQPTSDQTPSLRVAGASDFVGYTSASEANNPHESDFEWRPTDSDYWFTDRTNNSTCAEAPDFEQFYLPELLQVAGRSPPQNKSQKLHTLLDAERRQEFVGRLIRLPNDASSLYFL
jgi:hypothetical protein